MGQKQSAITVNTDKSLQDIGNVLRAKFASLKAKQIKPLSEVKGALNAFDTHADVEIYAQGGDFVSQWAVEVYVNDVGSHREVTLVALGNDGFERVKVGLTNSLSLSASESKRDAVAQSLT